MIVRTLDPVIDLKFIVMVVEKKKAETQTRAPVDSFIE